MSVKRDCLREKNISMVIVLRAFYYQKKIKKKNRKDETLINTVTRRSIILGEVDLANIDIDRLVAFPPKEIFTVAIIYINLSINIPPHICLLLGVVKLDRILPRLLYSKQSEHRDEEHWLCLLIINQ
ncbi:hypothetical protein T07_2118 [Trichinella nelsoni]|uniref:Uncharacterized protein n=1 Tax=Trichinella nelsoni TaxID=6336 RepID=A0A0V0S6U9_9BILA|nr:hypothetical protein T07_2118 [Trichinella nelsoni]